MSHFLVNPDHRRLNGNSVAFLEMETASIKVGGIDLLFVPGAVERRCMQSGRPTGFFPFLLYGVRTREFVKFPA